MSRNLTLILAVGVITNIDSAGFLLVWHIAQYKRRILSEILFNVVIVLNKIGLIEVSKPLS